MKNVLKTFLILLFLSLLLFLTYKVISKIKHKNEVVQNIKSIPEFSFQDLKGELFSNQNLKKIVQPFLFISIPNVSFVIQKLK